MQETKGEWYMPVKPFSESTRGTEKSLSEREEEARKRKDSGVLQKRMEFDLGGKYNG